MKDGLRFEKYGEEIEFIYTELDSDGFELYVSETIPTKIVKQGKKAMLKYASREINKVKKKHKKQKSVEEDIKKNHIPIQTKYKNGTSLEGRIVEATAGYISVELDKPVKGQSDINFGWGAAMVGQHVFTDDYKISPAGYDGAYRALCDAYEDVLHKPKKDLVDSLNEELEDSEET